MIEPNYSNGKRNGRHSVESARSHQRFLDYWIGFAEGINEALGDDQNGQQLANSDKSADHQFTRDESGTLLFDGESAVIPEDPPLHPTADDAAKVVFRQVNGRWYRYIVPIDFVDNSAEEYLINAAGSHPDIERVERNDDGDWRDRIGQRIVNLERVINGRLPYLSEGVATAQATERWAAALDERVAELEEKLTLAIRYQEALDERLTNHQQPTDERLERLERWYGDMLLDQAVRNGREGHFAEFEFDEDGALVEDPPTEFQQLSERVAELELAKQKRDGVIALLIRSVQALEGQ